jgi:uncharacterized membrane protein YdfJ with MMPL/SSD domain
MVVLIGRWNWWPSSLGEPESREEDESADERESRVVA